MYFIDLSYLIGSFYFFYYDLLFLQHCLYFFSIWAFLHEHSQITEKQGKGEANILNPLNPLHPLHRHLEIIRAIAAESSPLDISSSRTRTGSLFRAQVANH